MTAASKAGGWTTVVKGLVEQVDSLDRAEIRTFMVAIWTGVSPGYDACEGSTHHGRAGRLVDAKAVSNEDFPWMRFRLRSPIFTANGLLFAQVRAVLCGPVTP